jgi:hypothetical protein
MEKLQNFNLRENDKKALKKKEYERNRRIREKQ